MLTQSWVTVIALYFLIGKEKTTLKNSRAAVKKPLTFTTHRKQGVIKELWTVSKTGKELMSQDEITVMDGGKCIFSFVVSDLF